MSAKTLYDDLGVKKHDSHETIKQVFRKHVKKTHPDKGGDPQMFRAVVRAYNILSDEDKRRRYDNGENPDHINQSNSSEQLALNLVYGIFNSIIDQKIDFTHNNLFEIIRHSIAANKQNITNEKNKVKDNICRYQNILERIKKNERSKSFILILNDKLNDANGRIAQMDRDIKTCDDAIKLIEGCEYECDASVRMRFNLGTTTATTNW